MNKKVWALLLLPFVLSLSAAEAGAESIPVQRKAVVRTAARNPALRAAVRKPAAKSSASTEKKTGSLGPDVEVGLLSGGEVTLTGLSEFKAESAGKVVGKYGTGTRLSITRSGNTSSSTGKRRGIRCT